MPDDSDQPRPDGVLEDAYSMDEGRRPDHVRRRNRITGLVLLVLIAAVVAATVWSRASGDPQKYNPVGEPADELGDKNAPRAPDRPASER